jgi:hypothetical protein
MLVWIYALAFVVDVFICGVRNRAVAGKLFARCLYENTPPQVRAPPALGECRHRRLAVRGVAVGRRAVLVVQEGQCPHPRRADRSRIGLENAADNLAIGEHVEIVVTPLAGRTRVSSSSMALELMVAAAIRSHRSLAAINAARFAS